MIKFIIILLVVLNLLNIEVVEAGYNETLAEIGVYLSGSAYCEKNFYSTMKILGPAHGFVVTGILYDIPTDLQGFTGYLDWTKTIHLVLRGTSSKLNWLDDLDVKQVEYNTWPDCKCNVHDGFYRAALGLRNQTITQVKMLMAKNPKYRVIFNGHSLASSVADLLSMELLSEGISSELYIYGKPRVGDKVYAQYYDSKNLEHYRHTHDKDMIPHLPTIEGFGYVHSCQEIFEDSRGNLRGCSKTDCEDKNCGLQYKLSETNIQDHLYYLSHRVDCESSTD